MRYALFADVPLGPDPFAVGSYYLAFYNEMFINTEKDVGNGVEVEYFDRNRAYGAVGYVLSEKLRLQAGYMYQSSDAVQKGQVQLSLHQNFR